MYRKSSNLVCSSVLLACVWTIPAAADDLPPIRMNVLIAALSESDDEVVLGSITILAEMGPKAKEATAALVRTLGHGQHNIRWMACHALGQIGPEARVAIDALVNCTADAHWNVRAAAARSLASIDPASDVAMSALARLLSDPSRDVRWSAAYGLGKMQIATQTVLVALNERLGDDDPLVRREVAQVLKLIRNRQMPDMNVRSVPVSG